jgi:sarcosine oxidase subunit gamma
MRLAGSLQASGDDPRSLWLGPDRWLLVSDTITPERMLEMCARELAGIVHNAVDYSAALAVFRLTGPAARELLATGTGTDLRPIKFPVNSCCRTRLAQVAVVIVADAPQVFDIYIDRSYQAYLAKWIRESSSIYCSYRGDPRASCDA